MRFAHACSRPGSKASSYAVRAICATAVAWSCECVDPRLVLAMRRAVSPFARPQKVRGFAILADLNSSGGAGS